MRSDVVYIIEVMVMHTLSLAIAEACIARGWIEAQRKFWCAYAVEKKLISLCFFLLMIPFAVVLDVLPQATVFACAFYLLRRRYGGWHAPYAWLCQVISIALVLATTLFVGPVIMQLPLFAVWGMDAIVTAVAVIQPPVYPPQLHFDQEIKRANAKKKNLVLLVVLVFQLGLGIFVKTVLVYSLLAVLAGVISVYIEILQQCIYRKNGFYEQT